MQKVFVTSKEEGVEKAKEIIYDKVDPQTLLFLSGGSSPKPLYETLAREKKLHAGAVAMIDERYGEPMHKRSNEKMIRGTGLLTYLKEENILWYPMLQKNLSREETAGRYEKVLKTLFEKFPKRVAIMSIGADGHTAGIPAQMSNVKYQMSNLHNRDKFIIDYNDTTGPFGERITLSFAALEQMNYFLLWVFGDEKNEALHKVFEKGSDKEVPGRFYNRPEISEKTVLITDQKI